MRDKLFLYFFFIILFSSGINSCKSDKVEIETDILLFKMAKSTAGITWYKNSNILLDKSSGSGHPQAYLRTRFNSIAATTLDVNGKIINGSIFPEGSLIVKELFENTTTLSRYAILYKDGNSPDADANGWVWGYIDSDGTVATPASSKGSSCIGCHSQSDNIDYMLMNKFFP